MTLFHFYTSRVNSHIAYTSRAITKYLNFFNAIHTISPPNPNCNVSIYISFSLPSPNTKIYSILRVYFPIRFSLKRPFVLLVVIIYLNKNFNRTIGHLSHRFFFCFCSIYLHFAKCLYYNYVLLCLFPARSVLERLQQLPVRL